MAVRETTYDAGPESIPPRARFGFRISCPREPFALTWRVEVWRKPPRVYQTVESQSLFDVVRMWFIVLTHKEDPNPCTCVLHGPSFRYGWPMGNPRNCPVHGPHKEEHGE